MRKTPRNFLQKIKQTDLFPNREAVGTENEVVMIARFGGGVENFSNCNESIDRAQNVAPERAVTR